jgi:glyoxylase-like metal-dependent hydrolase (beta-lactamase superfamily II)
MKGRLASTSANSASAARAILDTVPRVAWTFGDWQVSRIADPGFELLLPSDVEALRRSPWLSPQFVTDDWQLRVGSSAILVQGPGVTALVDPWLAFDGDFDARLRALAEAGVEPADVDTVVNSHVDGIGANTRPGTAEPAFPNARYLLPAAEVEAVEAGRNPGAEGLAKISEPLDGRVEIAPGLSVEPLPGHSAGHVGVAIGSPTAALVTGHLFLHPAHLANPDVTLGDLDPDVLRSTRRTTLDRCVDEGLVLIGPLFALPGGGRVRRDGDRWALDAA